MADARAPRIVLIPRPDLAHTLLRTLGPVLVLTACYALLPLRGERWWLGAAISLVVVAAVVPLTLRRIAAVKLSERPVLDAIEALVLVISMLILGFAAAYFAMNVDGDQFSGLDSRVDALYFVIVTLGTVGFGDVVPQATAARLVVSFNILFNLAFLGVAVRVLVTAAREGRQRIEAV
jgi:voltage-gated potassium channel